MKKLLIVFLLLINYYISYSYLCSGNAKTDVEKLLFYEDKMDEQRIKAKNSRKLENYKLFLFYVNKMNEITDHVIIEHYEEIKQQINKFYQYQDKIKELKTTLDLYIKYEESRLNY